MTWSTFVDCDEKMNAQPPLMASEREDNLATRAAVGFGWNLIGFAVRVGLSFGISILLARLLGPKPYGLVAMAMVIVALGNLIVESGLGVQLIQKKTVSKRAVRGVFTLQVLFGLMLAAGVMFATPLIADILKQDAVRPVMRALAFMLVIESAGQASTALLRRDLRFKAIQVIQIVSYLVGYGLIGIPLALSGAGVWTLVWAQLTQAALCSVISWALVRHSLMPYLGSDLTSLLRFGSVVSGSNVLSWSIGSMPTFVIGRIMGAASLGLYNRAYMLVSVPLAVLASSLQTVSLSLYSRIQEDEDTVRRAFLAIIALVALIAFPCFLLVAGTSASIVRVLLGTRWGPAAPLAIPLAFAMPFDALAAVSSSLLISRGRPDLDFRTQIITAFFGAVSLAVAVWARSSLLVFSLTVCFCFYILRSVVAAILVRRLLCISWSKYAQALSGGVLAGAVVLIVVGIINFQLDQMQAWLHLLIAGSVGLISVLMLVITIPRTLLSQDLIWLVTDRSLPIPDWIHKWLKSLGLEETQVAEC